VRGGGHRRESGWVEGRGEVVWPRASHTHHQGHCTGRGGSQEEGRGQREEQTGKGDTEEKGSEEGAERREGE